MHEGCYICKGEVTIHDTMKKIKHPSNMATLDHYVPVWFLKAIGLPEGILYPPNFRVCCHKCNKERDSKIRTVAALRRDVGDELVDTLLKVTKVDLSDTESIITTKDMGAKHAVDNN